MWLACTSPDTPETPDDPPPSVCGEGLVNVAQDGDDYLGDGSPDRPLATLAKGLELARASDLAGLAVHGSLDQDLQLVDATLTLQGCGQASMAGLRVDGGQVDVQELTLLGQVRYRSGATGSLTALAVDGGEAASLVVRGEATSLSLTDVRLSGAQPRDGLALGAVVDGATVVAQDVVVQDAQGVGVLVSGAGRLEATGLEVSVVAGDMSRAVQVQDWSVATLTQPRLVSTEVAVLARQAPSVTLEGGQVDSADGVVLGQPDTAFDVGLFQASVQGVTVTAQGAPVLAQDVTLTADSEVWAQGAAQVSGVEPSWVEHDVDWSTVDAWSF